jgi:hypothetical protein
MGEITIRQPHAENLGKLRKEGEQKAEKGLSAICDNLLLLSGLARLRQDLVNLVSCV